MASDQIFNKKREARKKFERESVKRSRNTRILILTEGKKTEPFYLEAFCKSLDVDGVFINKDSEGRSCFLGSSPKTLVTTAKKEAKVKESSGQPNVYYWDKIFCVFDKDHHEKFEFARNEIHQLQKKYKDRVIQAIVSNICFELWYLLHFNYTNRQYTSCDAVISELKKIKINGSTPFESYSKGGKGYFDILNEHIHIAHKNAKLLQKDKKFSPDSSYTEIYVLLDIIEAKMLR